MGKRLEEMGPEELGRLFPILLVPHDPAWAQRYAEEAERIGGALGGVCRRIRHIGSTAISGIAAKPTVDILLEIASGADPGFVKDALLNMGYRFAPQPDKPAPHMMFMKGYTERGFSGQAYHVHVRYLGDWDEPYFCAYLSAHPKVAAEYERLKLDLSEKFPFDRDGYTAAKGELVSRVTRLARQDFAVRPGEDAGVKGGE